MQKKLSSARWPRLAAAAVGLAVAVAPIAAAPAQADPADDAFFAALSASGIQFDNKGAAKAVARGVCPSLAHGAKDFTWVVAGVVAGGIPRKLATTFAGQAVKSYCPDRIQSAFGV